MYWPFLFIRTDSDQAELLSVKWIVFIAEQEESGRS